MSVIDLLSGIKNISQSRVFKSLWQWLNLRYLYYLLYPFIAQDFRQQMDCNACVSQIQLHTHIVQCAKCGFPSTLPPMPPPTVTPAMGLALIGIDPLTGLACLNVLTSGSITVATMQPFDPTNIVNFGKANIGFDVNPLNAEAEAAAKAVTSPSKWLSV